LVRDASDDRARNLELLTAWQSGDTTAGERLFDRHADAVVRFFENKVRNDAEELVQVTFLRMLEGHSRIRDFGAFPAFVFAIARNVLREHLRELARGREVDPEVDSMAALVPGPSTVVGEREEHRLLLEGLRRLSIEDQILVELTYWEDLDSDTLGEIVGMPASSVRTRLSRARERLRQTVAELAATPTMLTSTVEGMEGWAAELHARLRAGQESRN
jgi:RNA polymerase sigma factor (sigma-70 family)